MADKYVLPEDVKEVFEEAISLFGTLSHQYYDENPGWFDRDMWECLMDLVNGKTWED